MRDDPFEQLNPAINIKGDDNFATNYKDLCLDKSISVYTWGIPLFNLNQFDKAEEFFKVALELNPIYSDALYYLGLIHHELLQFDEEERIYCKILEIDPHHVKTINRLIHLHNNDI